MHFGPEWMRTKGTARPAPSPPLTTSPAPPGNASYSALVTPATHPPPEGKDVAHPFRYSKEEMLRIYKEGGGRGGLGLEVERWEGIVREIGYDPVGLKEMSDAEKKLYSGPLNSEVRRRQSTDFLSPLTTTGLGERPKLALAGSGAGSPMRERIGSFMGRRRDSTDQMPLTIPRKLSLSNMQGPLASPRDGALPSPRVRPGFDGVLSETWSARRRNAELAKASNGLTKAEKDGDGDGKGTYIQEQEEEALHGSERMQKDGDSGGGASSELNTASNGGNTTSDTSNQLNGQLDKLSINGLGNTQPQGTANTIQPPPGLGDLSSIEWSYLDPQGNVQGPFPAGTMQRWHESKYFTNDLLMKRTHLDTEWTPFGVLCGRAGDQPVFLTPLVHAPTPPGLPRLDTVVNNGIPERNQQSPYQPVPTRNLRSSTLDSYLTNGGTVPESPSSSMGGGRFASPDPVVFDTRIGGAQMGFNQGAESRMPFAGGPGQRRATLNNESGDPIFGNRAFASPVAGRTPGVDGMGFAAGGHPSILNDTMSSPFGHRAVQNPGVINGHPGSSVLNGSDLGSIGGMHSNQGTPSRVLNRDPFGKPLDDIHGGAFSNTSSPFISNAVPAFPQTPLSHFAGQETRSLHTMTPDRQPVAPLSFAHQLQQPFAQSPSFNNAPSPWLAQDAAPFRRPGPFEPNHPTSNNTFVPQPIAHSQSFGQPTQGGIPAAQSPWQTAQPVNNDPWGVASSNLTVANLGQHNEQQRQAEIHHQPPQENAAAFAEQPQAQAVPSPTVAPAAPAETSAPQKTRRKSGAQAVPQAPKVPSPTAAKPPSPILAPPPVTAATSEPKVPWAVDDEKKPRTPGGALNLREIQEAEAKKTEARKVAERERERAARAAAANTQAEDFQPFTASWGLPTSQAGAARVKETPAASPLAAPSANAAAPVWTNATKAPVAKKTMKEIQEEEERRKKQAAAKEKESMAATARRGYAETTTKAAAPVQVGGAWTTVGSGGKVSAVATPPAVAAVARPTATPVVSSKAVPTVVAAASPVVTPRPAAAVTPRPVAAVLKATPSKEDNSIAPGPSLEFLKWMSDSLKGLNSSVNLEDITSMLLSFPLDPDQSTVEIISDLIYASSTTLDGRRFAAEFVSKRKVDAAARPKGVTASGSASKPLSIADVVKAQPKPAQNEWGFKVVNKKKKGGRA
ncbi:GYF domain-containing protein mpd2 [Trametes pubescens]|uniref:GYF domain-containing protein mpd2 n=1 Tax=Trametes pubescens TaxID=154538 RepID=A0A1M2W026_TRAPU|nr:GYF domain-containing protein mpd2 [Trametes pubescens]